MGEVHGPTTSSCFSCCWPMCTERCTPLGRMRPHLGAHSHGVSAPGEWDAPCLSTEGAGTDPGPLLLLEPPDQLRRLSSHCCCTGGWREAGEQAHIVVWSPCPGMGCTRRSRGPNDSVSHWSCSLCSQAKGPLWGSGSLHSPAGKICPRLERFAKVSTVCLEKGCLDVTFPQRAHLHAQKWWKPAFLWSC